MEKPFLEEGTQTAIFIELANHMASLIVAERELQSLQQELVRLTEQEHNLQHQMMVLQSIPTF